MPVGFQAFDSQGRIVCDLTDRLPKVMGAGIITLDAGYAVNINFSGMVADGTWYVQSTEQTINIVGNGFFTMERVDRRPNLPDPEPNQIYYTVIKQ